VNNLKNLMGLILVATVSFAVPKVASANITSNLSTDFLAAETANDEDGSFGQWTLGGLNNATATPGTFTAWTNAQHLDNWGTNLPNNGGNGPFSNGEFKGYGYDTALAIPAIVINTSNTSLSPCCGISSYAPGQIFIHSGNAGDGDPARQTMDVRYTAPGTGFVNISALFTEMHTGSIPFNVLVNGISVDSGTLVGQNSTHPYSANGLAVFGGETIDFLIAGRASSSLSASITFIPEPASMGLLAVGGLATLRRRRR
jgi:hypothetical protein